MCDIDRFSLLVVTWDGDLLLKGCLDSVVAVYNRLPPTVVVDNAKSPTTESLVAGYDGVDYVAAPTNLGFAGGNNLGFDRCRGEYVILLNNDTEFTGDSLTELVDFMDANPQVGAAQGRIVCGDDRRRLDYCGLQLTPIGQTAAPGLGLSVDDERFARPYSVFAASGAFLMVRRAAIAAMGGKLFRDEFKSYYEDVDLGQRLWMCGYEVWYCPTVPVVHFGSKTSRRFSSASIAEQGYCNRWYSLLMSYRLPGLAYLVPQLALLFFGHALMSALRGDSVPLKTQLRAVRRVFGNRQAILAERRRFLPLRRISDWQLLRRLVVRQPWSYYLGLIGVNRGKD